MMGFIGKTVVVIGLFVLFVFIFHNVGEESDASSERYAADFNRTLAESRNRELETGINAPGAAKWNEDGNDFDDAKPVRKSDDWASSRNNSDWDGGSSDDWAAD
ncbi:hypothetical protein GCM10011371_13490 [Novosphingobium marinum]|uniref:Uncharacterized protein n=1 Tax=Novosphingobium marinum TaxID=1514948 RepID=A0A7Y9XVT3_9SPHN|nr:hypothetical protein [Novosphingobium marinum]NYH95457.1 hypothetical protein [Novosphingobium marinum]GGC27219.1 hypothetical protein GCM10011371_13490 [Novosphingobium marinum]